MLVDNGFVKQSYVGSKCFLLLILFLGIYYSSTASALEKVTLKLKYLHQFQFAGYYAALEKGYYRTAGLAVSIVEKNGNGDPESDVLSGLAEYGVGTSSLLLAVNAGKPLVVLGVIFQHSPYTFLMPYREGERGLSSLVGKKVMISEAASEIVAYLKSEGISLNDMVLLPHSYNPDDLIQGRVDGLSAYVTNEPEILDRAGFRYRAFSPRSAGIDFYGDNLFTSEKVISEHPAQVEAFRKASIQGWQYAMKHPEEIVELILSKYSKRNSRTHLMNEAEKMRPLLLPDLVDIGYMSSSRWRHIADTYAGLGMLPEDFQFERFLYGQSPRENFRWWYIVLAILGMLTLVSSTFSVRRLVRERERYRDELELKNILLSTQQEASTDGLLAVDKDGWIISANQIFLDFWGLNHKGFSAWSEEKYLEEIVDNFDDPKIFLRRINELNCQHRLTSSDEIVLKDGRVIDRYSAPLISFEGHYFGRLWSYRDITKRKESEKLIWDQANLDFLTGLPNRYMLHDRLSREIKKARRSNRQVGLLLLDLDNFKEVNDTMGHEVGDLLIRETASRLRQCIRDTDTIARIGGDEFTVILAEVREFLDVDSVANKILVSLSKPFRIAGEVAYISSSIGITMYPEDGADVESLMKNADQAMYAAKSQGRNCSQYYTPEMQKHALKRLSIANDLRDALTEDQFELHYQPIIDLATGRIVKAEALLRWRHPERGLVSPVDFIPIAEETGMICKIGDWVFLQASCQLKRWRDNFDSSFQLGINVSPVQFRPHRADVDWFGHLKSLDLPRAALIIEITEGLLMESSCQVTDKLMAFRKAGIHVALDDFGTGYSSLSYLKIFDIDYLKIDRSFVRYLNATSNDLALCEAIIVMAHKLGIRVISEGIETEQQRQLLADAKCDFAQGYLFSRPVPATQFEKLFTLQTEYVKAS